MKLVPPELKPPWFQPWVASWKRPLALPLYLYWPYDVLPPWEPGEPDEFGNVCAGRMIVWGDACYRRPSKALRTRIAALRAEIAKLLREAAEAKTQSLAEARRTECAKARARLRRTYHRNFHPREPIPRASWANVCDTDIVYVPLFAGVDDPCEPPIGRGRGADERLPHAIWEANFEALQAIAPKAKVVLTGNLFMESAWADYESPTNHTMHEQWQSEIRAHQFMEAASRMIREAGGRPAFALVPWEIRLDCANGFGRLRDMFTEFDAVMIHFQADEIIGDFDEAVKEGYPEDWRKPPRYPYPQWLNYYSGVESIGGCTWERILADDWDIMLKDHGLTAIC